MTRTELQQYFEQMNNLTALVVGDVMIDAYYWGNVDRISPEAPVPIVHVNKYDNRLGGAANVALNLMALGVKPVICSLIGDDVKGHLFEDLLAEKGFDARGVIKAKSRTTTVKTRIIAEGHHMLRVDEEDITPLNNEDEQKYIRHFRKLMDEMKIDVIVMEDYNKGVLTPNVIEAVISLANERNIPTTVDPKKENFFAFKNCTLFKPNLKELKEGLMVDFDKHDPKDLLLAIEACEHQLKNKISLTTLSELGVVIKAGNEFFHVPAHKREIMDVSGAGDTVISIASVLLALDVDLEWIASISNLGGGLVCEKIGVVPIDKITLLQEAERLIK